VSNERAHFPIHSTASGWFAAATANAGKAAQVAAKEICEKEMHERGEDQ
jgi:hypothetical protein